MQMNDSLLQHFSLQVFPVATSRDRKDVKNIVTSRQATACGILLPHYLTIMIRVTCGGTELTSYAAVCAQCGHNASWLTTSRNCNICMHSNQSSTTWSVERVPKWLTSQRGEQLLPLRHWALNNEWLFRTDRASCYWHRQGDVPLPARSRGESREGCRRSTARRMKTRSRSSCQTFRDSNSGAAEWAK